MSITYYPFAPNTLTNFTFTPTFSGTQYVVIVKWSPFGVRWLVQVYTLSGTLVVSKPMQPSPEDYDINLIEGYIDGASLVYREASDTFEVNT